MYFELLENSTEDGGGFSFHMCVYNEDKKGRRVVGCPVKSIEELHFKANALHTEINEIVKQGEVLLKNKATETWSYNET